MLSASEQLPQTLGCCPGRTSQPEALEEAQVLEFQSQLCLTSWVVLTKSLNLPEPQSVHLPNGGSMLALMAPPPVCRDFMKRKW